MGDFTEKASAEKFCAELKTGEYSGAWVVAGPIDLLVDGFRIQLASMKTLTSAATYARLVESELPLVVHLVKAEDGWKIRVGDFIDKIEAEKKKQELQAKGYSGAWVVEDKVKK
jgi:acetyl/propionyl-CoA carboxylase alpha subunit